MTTIFLVSDLSVVIRTYPYISISHERLSVLGFSRPQGGGNGGQAGRRSTQLPMRGRRR